VQQVHSNPDESVLPVFDHGAAKRVPAPGEVRYWRHLETWLGDRGIAEIEVGLIRVFTALGEQIAHSGDWIVLSVRGDLYVARGDRSACHA
jgi:hypothetical protein